MLSFRRWWWVLVLVLALFAGGFVVWADSTAPPMSEALKALESAASTDGVIVDASEWLAFLPADREPTIGLVFYPGGRVDPRAYAPAARSIAAEGPLVVIVPMPLNLAVFGQGRAESVFGAFPRVTHWAIGGHSLGGAMAARFVHRHPTSVEGLVLWASFRADGDGLAEQDIEVVSIYSTLDGVATVDEINASRPRFPSDTRWVAIEGGNHAQFGWYGTQAGDNPAAVSRESQQRTAVAETIRLLESLPAEEE